MGRAKRWSVESEEWRLEHKSREEPPRAPRAIESQQPQRAEDIMAVPMRSRVMCSRDPVVISVPDDQDPPSA